MSGCAGRRQFNGALERLFGGVAVPAAKLQLAEVGVGRAALGLQLDGFFELRYCAVEILQSRERVGKEDLRVDTL